MSQNFEFAAVRRKKIVDLVQERGAIGMRDLCDQFGMSEATIRRDLKELDARGLVARTHGGATINSNVMVDVSNEERKAVGAAEKQRIGATAIELLAGNEVVFLDAGTTALAMAAHAHKRPGCTYATTSLGVANLLQSQRIQHFYLIGGAYRPLNDSFAGILAVTALRSLSFDWAFLCCSAIDVGRRSISIVDESYSQIQKEAIAVSRKIFVMADHRKFKATAFMRTASFDEIYGVITTTEVDGETIAQLRNTCMELVLA